MSLAPHRNEAVLTLLILIEQSLSRSLLFPLSDLFTNCGVAGRERVSGERAAAAFPARPPAAVTPPVVSALSGPFSAAARKTVIDSGRPDRPSDRASDSNSRGDGGDHPRVVDEDEGSCWPATLEPEEEEEEEEEGEEQ